MIRGSMYMTMYTQCIRAPRRARVHTVGTGLTHSVRMPCAVYYVMSHMYYIYY